MVQEELVKVLTQQISLVQTQIAIVADNTEASPIDSEKKSQSLGQESIGNIDANIFCREEGSLLGRRSDECSASADGRTRKNTSYLGVGGDREVDCEGVRKDTGNFGGASQLGDKSRKDTSLFQVYDEGKQDTRKDTSFFQVFDENTTSNLTREGSNGGDKRTESGKGTGVLGSKKLHESQENPDEAKSYESPKFMSKRMDA